MDDEEDDLVPVGLAVVARPVELPDDPDPDPEPEPLDPVTVALDPLPYPEPGPSDGVRAPPLEAA